VKTTEVHHPLFSEMIVLIVMIQYIENIVSLGKNISIYRNIFYISRYFTAEVYIFITALPK